jgi:transcriptional regulator with XRE-family HTH domain
MTDRESWRNVGERIRRLRKENRLTIKQLAARCNLSANAISLVERGEVAPTVMSLCKIAHALGASAASFFQEVCPVEVVLDRANDRQQARIAEATVDALTGNCAREIRVPNEGRGCSLPGHGAQMLLCVSGSVEYEVDEQHYCLSPGDRLIVHGNAFQRWCNPGHEPGIAVLVLMPQSA